MTRNSHSVKECILSISFQYFENHHFEVSLPSDSFNAGVLGSGSSTFSPEGKYSGINDLSMGLV